MPELPEVETVCRGLAARLEGRRLARVSVRRGDLRRPLPPDFALRLGGRRVECVARRGKYILVHLDGGEVLIVHLGMSGRLCVHDESFPAPPPGPHDHVLFETSDGATIVFHDARRFGLMALSAEDALAHHPLLAELGPEPVGDGFAGPILAAALAGRAAPIKSALMDQRVVAGLGNIYTCESLFRAGLSPLRRAGTVVGRRAERLAAAIRDVLGEAISAGGSSLHDHMRPSGELGYFQHRFAVYDREGLPCPGCTCGGVVRRIVQSGRSTFYCARRQR